MVSLHDKKQPNGRLKGAEGAQSSELPLKNTHPTSEFVIMIYNGSGLLLNFVSRLVTVVSKAVRLKFEF